MGTDPEPSRVVDPGDAPAARPDRVHVHHRDPHRVAGDHPLASNEGLRPGDERDVGARAAHVQGDEIVVSGRRSGRLSADDARRRTGQEEAHGAAAGDVRAREPPARLHHLERRRHPGVRETRGEIGKVAPHRWLDVRVEGGDRGPFVLPERGVDLARERDLEVRMRRAHDLPYPALVLRVDEREEEAHRDALGATGDEPVEGVPHRALVEGFDDLPGRTDPLPNADPHRARREEHRRLGVEPDLVHLLAHLAPDLEGVPEPLGGDDPEPAALAFEHRVRRHRGAVRKLSERACRDPLRREALHRGERGLPGVRGRARHLEHDGRAPVAQANHIRERASDIHPDPVSGPWLSHDFPLSRQPPGIFPRSAPDVRTRLHAGFAARTARSDPDRTLLRKRPWKRARCAASDPVGTWALSFRSGPRAARPRARTRPRSR